MNYYLEPWKKYAEFGGRARRKEYWMFVLINSAIVLVLEILSMVNEDSSLIFLGLYAILAVAMLIPSIAVTVRRLHDTNRSGWWYFINFVPLIGGIWLFILTLLGGTAGENKYGPDPKAGTISQVSQSNA